MKLKIDTPTPAWALPLLKPARYKVVRGGRGSGKSHFVAEEIVLTMVHEPDCKVVCIREVQKSLKFSSKQLIENKIRALGVGDLFDITQTEIRRVGGQGICIFQGMQDHTADSIKSLEGFKIAWVEEAQSLSHRSLQLLRPTIRMPGSTIWFTYNPDQETDAVDAFFCGENTPPDSIIVHVNCDKNPFLPDELRKEMEYDRRIDPEAYEHVWLGGYNTRSKASILGDKYSIDEFEPDDSFGEPLFGADWGFSQDPTTLVRLYIKDNILYVDQELYKIGLEIDDTPSSFNRIPDVEKHTIRADSARPETISYVRRHGLSIVGAKKWEGSVEDGIKFIRSFEKIVIHPRCTHTIQEFRLYSYKIDERTGDILKKIVDKHNHIIDAIRYALEPMIKRGGGDVLWL